MNRNDRIQPLLQSWVDHRLAPSSDDLLAGVMREVESISQRRETWRSWLSMSRVTAWVTVAATVAILATAIGLPLASLTGPPAPPPVVTPTPTPSPTASPTPWQANATPAQIVDALISAWKGQVTPDLASFYTDDARLFLVTDSPEWSAARERVISGRGQIRAWRVDQGYVPALQEASEVLQQGSYLAVELWDRKGVPDSAIWVLDLTADNLVQRQYVFSVTDDGMFGWDGPPSAAGYANDQLIAALDAEITAMNSYDGAANAAYYTTDGAWLLAVAADPWSEEYIGRDAIAATTEGRASIDFHVTRSGPALNVGSLLVYPWTMTGALGNAEGFGVIGMGGDYLYQRPFIATQWVVGGRASLPSSPEG